MSHGIVSDLKHCCFFEKLLNALLENYSNKNTEICFVKIFSFIFQESTRLSFFASYGFDTRLYQFFKFRFYHFIPVPVIGCFNVSDDSLLHFGRTSGSMDVISKSKPALFREKKYI